MASRRDTERVSFAARAARARELAVHAPAAEDLLRFYAALAEYQQQLADSVRGAADADWVGRSARELIAWLPGIAPPRLRASAETMREVTAEEWRDLFDSYRADPDYAADRFGEAALFALEAVLQPVAEQLSMFPLSHAASSHQRCPDCGGLPVVGVLREAGHGGRRRLVCRLCATEWDSRRLVCVACGEERFDALPVFTAEQFPHVRIEACDTCRSYLKTIDATRDGRAIPVVDDIASVALDLWARDQGYTRVRTNLIGM